MGRPPVLRPTQLCVPVVALALAAAPVAAQTPVFLDGFESGAPCEWSPVVGVAAGTCPDAYRASTLALRDPHVYVDFASFCIDFTDSDVPGFPGSSFNGSLATAIATDGDGDGYLDLSSLLLFQPLDESGTGAATLASGLCLPPASSTVCAPDPNSPATVATYATLATGVCLAPIPGTTFGYSPPVVSTPAPCFATDAVDATLTLNGVTIPLHDVRVAGTFAGDPATGFTDGLMMGFLTEADADATLLPANLPLVGGQPLSILLPGGANNCAGHDDRDTDNAVVGWWFYFNSTSAHVPYGEP